MTPARIQLIGRDNTVPAHMTDAQRERAEGPWEDDAPAWDYWLTMAIVFAVSVVIGCLI